jgi:hypothetical protein
MLNRNDVLKKGIARVKIEEIYKEKMGQVIFSYTEKIFLRNGKLYITLKSAPLKFEMIQSKNALKDIINETLGTIVVEEIIIK